VTLIYPRQNTSQSPLGGVGGHCELGVGEWTAVDLFGPQFRVCVLDEVGSHHELERGERTGLTCFIAKFTTGHNCSGWGLS
jgi:hypothetical protein